MIKIDKNGNISLTRGDVLSLTISATSKDGSLNEFQIGDVVRFKIVEKDKCNCVVLQKDAIVSEVSNYVDLFLTSEDTKIGKLINRPTDYWYEVEVNPDTNPQTIIGYSKDDGAKLFTLLPEGGNRA